MSKDVLALALCRVSSLEQENSNSLTRQAENVLARSKELGAVILDGDWWSGSVSSKRGTNIDRKDLQAMLERCSRDKRVKYIIVDEVDRFMRSMLELGYFLVEFKRLGVQVIFASQPNLKTDTAIDTLLLMLEAFKAEGSNEERQHKSIEGQTKALQAGRYTFAPKPGYMKGRITGVPEINPKCGKALQNVLLDIVYRRTTPTQGLINLNNSEFMSGGHSLYKMDKFRKIVTDPFYAGVVEINKQVQVRNEKGLHKPLITLEEHYELVRIMNAKKKNQTGPRENGNPEYPASNMVTCDICLDKQYPRFVGFKHSNGKNANLQYHKYRCRSCKRYLSRDELHNKIVKLFQDNPITKAGYEDVVEALNIAWKREENRSEQAARRIQSTIKLLKQEISDKVEATTNPKYAAIHDEILDVILKKKAAISEFESQLFDLVADSESDNKEFLQFAYNFIENIGENFLNTDLVSRENRVRCKNLIFPAGFYLDSNNKVYTPRISELYRLATMKKDDDASGNSHLVRVKRL